MTISEIFNAFSIPSYVFFGLFVVASIAELLFSFFENEKVRRIVKPFCLFFLSLFAFFATNFKAPLIYVGAFLGMLGDIFVIAKDRKYFNLGVLFFFFGHLCYISQLIIYMVNKSSPIYSYIIFGVFYVLIYIGLYFLFIKIAKSKVEKFGLPLYYGTLFSVLPLIVMAFIFSGSYLYFGIIGIVLFVISDLIILYTKYVKEFKRYDFFIMSTYLLAQLFLVSSLVLTFIDLGL